MASVGPAEGIEPGEKFSCVALVRVALAAPLKQPLDLGYGCWALPSLPVSLDDQWRLAIGTVLAQEVERANLVLLAKARSVAPAAHDEQTQVELPNRVQFLLWGVAIAAGAPTYDRAVCLAGGAPVHKPEVWSVVRPERLFPMPGIPAVVLNVCDLVEACGVLARIEHINQEVTVDERSYWRIRRGLRALISGLQSREAEVRLHQFVRGIEAFLPPGDWREQGFVNAARMFVRKDPDPSQVLREMYRLRNAAEHMTDFRSALPYVPMAHRDATAMRRVRQAHALAAALYRRLFRTPSGYLDLFRDDDSIRWFWREPEPVRTSLWGEVVDLEAIG